MPVPLRKFSQNWLANDDLADALVRAMDVESGQRFLEVGPGDGRLTRALLQAGASVTAVEVDERCCAALAGLAEATGGTLTVLQRDVLDFDPVQLGDEPRRFAGNLPYAIASPILRWTARHHARIIDVHYMVPADVAERMLAPAGAPQRALLSVLVQWFFEGSVVRRLGPGAFRPQPKIASAFVRLRPRVPPACAAPGRHRRAVVQAAFAHRRKTLANSLRLAGWSREQADEALEAAGIDAGARPHVVEVDQYARLAEALPVLSETEA